MKLFIPLLAVLFIGLKLSDVIDWSWLLVISPLYLYVWWVVPVVFAYVALGVMQLSNPKKYAKIQERLKENKERRKPKKSGFAKRLEELQRKAQEKADLN